MKLWEILDSERTIRNSCPICAKCGNLWSKSHHTIVNTLISQCRKLKVTHIHRCIHIALINSGYTVNRLRQMLQCKNVLLLCA
jgi:hypothetical protein